MSPLSVHLNRDRIREIDAPASFAADGPFDVALRNHGEGSHVHLQFDESLSDVARLREDSPYVDADSTVRVGVDTRAVDAPVTGELTVAMGYGTETQTVELRIEPSRAEGYGIDVDEGLARSGTDRTVREALDAETAGLLALAGVALFAAVGVSVLVESAVVVAAAAVVALVTLVGIVLALT